MADGSPHKRPKVDDGPNEDEVEGTEGQADTEADAVLEAELRTAQAELDQRNEEMLERMRQVEQEFNAKKKPFYQQRGHVISRIPGFWLHCFMQHPDIRDIMGAVDQDILSNLTELEVEPFDDVKSGYVLRLHFSENDFFDDKLLEKKICFFQEPDSPILCSVTGCEPRWKVEDPTEPESIKIGRKRGRDSIAFFRWFTQPNTFEPGNIDPLADIIKEQLWVNPLEFMDPDEDAEVEEDQTEEGEEPEVWDIADSEDKEGSGGLADVDEAGVEDGDEEYQEAAEGVADEALDDEDAGALSGDYADDPPTLLED